MEGKSSDKNHLKSKAKEGTKPYLMDDPFTIQRMYQMLLAKLSDNEINEVLRQGKQRLWRKKTISNARHNMKAKEKKANRKTIGKHEYSDQIMATLDRLYTQHETFVHEIIHVKLNEAPIIFLYEPHQITQVAQHCNTNLEDPSVFAIDR